MHQKILGRKGLIHKASTVAVCTFTLGVFMATLAGCEKQAPDLNIATPIESSEVAPAATISFQDALKNLRKKTEPIPFEGELALITPNLVGHLAFTAEYPEDPNTWGVDTIDDIDVVTTAWGLALFRGDQDQVERYLSTGVSMTEPVWYKAGNNLPVRTFPAHLAINAIYMNKLPPAFLTEVLELGADPNALETMYIGSEQSVDGWSQQTVLHHAVISEIPALVEVVLSLGTAELNQGTITEHSKISPLHMAVIRSNEVAVRLLLEHGADPTQGATGSSGVTKSPLNQAKAILARDLEPAQHSAAKEIVELLTAAKVNE